MTKITVKQKIVMPTDLCQRISCDFSGEPIAAIANKVVKVNCVIKRMNNSQCKNLVTEPKFVFVLLSITSPCQDLSFTMMMILPNKNVNIRIIYLSYCALSHKFARIKGIS